MSKNIYQLPFKGDFPKQEAPFHKEVSGLEHAIDFAMPIGTPILAALDGEVWIVDTGYEGGTEKSLHPNNIIIKHNKGEYSRYVHIQDEVFVVEGQCVLAGEIIATCGMSGYTTYPHLHFDVVKENSTIPITFIDS